MTHTDLADRIPDAYIKLLWEKTNGEAWEPTDRNHAQVRRLIDAGYLVRCPMRCGFEAFDTGVKWTEAGKQAAAAIRAQGAAQPMQGEEND